MAQLQLLQLTYLDNHEIGGDEVYINIGGREYNLKDGWEPDDLNSWNSGDSHSFRDKLFVSNDVPRNTSITISLFEDDIILAGDDLLGTAAVTQAQRGNNPFDLTFTGSDATYVATFDFI